MRRGRLGAILVSLALLVQLLGPIAAAQAIAGSSGHIQVCLDRGPSDPTDRAPSGDVPSHHEHCSLCQLLCATPGLVEARSDSVTLPRLAESAVAWEVERAERALGGLDARRYPRGPPVLV
jgi:hypothetical protein